MAASTRTHLSQTADRISHIARQNMEHILAAQAAAERHRTASEQAEVRREESDSTRIKKGIERRLPLARKGLQALMELGQTPDIQKILASFRKPYPPVMHFYEAARVTGWYWAASKEAIRKMEETGGELVTDKEDGMRVCRRQSPYDEEHLDVCFEPGSLRFTSGAVVSWSGGICYTVYYKPFEDDPEHQVEVEGLRAEQRGELLSLDEFLHRIACPDPIDMGAIAHPGQRTCKWEPEDVFFQLLVSCGRPKAFDRYLIKCLKSLEGRSSTLPLF